MKIFVALIMLFVAGSVAYAADDVVDYLKARSSGDKIYLEWRSASETNVVRYEIERAGKDGIFRYVAAVSAKGSMSTYEYSDDEAFRKPDGAQLASLYFTYRLRIIYKDKPADYSVTAGVNHNVSSIRRTWGMIKEMFR
ncbi:MAG: hypothetical protein OKBPIBMD_01212 [Chlorobi bacterium]|nr:MAG: hypothetical protein F9K28_02820 [Bacteroidota bacterium]KXK35692.1 MAG: hypothetical protein UZ06_CHB003000426 [Chlorobi bacterium OLB6]MBV6463765.1 hypothetical protein [Chlorobiota bacterium]MBW7853636.1 hypothetical protein [Candidatus Kapabacteria bacterium]MCC6332130.1 hypothetical protein [Ignavibacteria bacterium]